MVEPGGVVTVGVGAGAGGPASGPGLGTGPGRQATPSRIRVAPNERAAAVDMGAKVVVVENLQQSGIESDAILVGLWRVAQF